MAVPSPNALRAVGDLESQHTTTMKPFLIAILLLLTFGPRFASAAPITVKDARGVTVTFQTPPQRIISLTPGITEMLFALNLGHRVIADTAYCDYPAAARSLPKIGDMNINYERILALKPDLVVADASGNRSALARLKQLKVPLLVIAPTSYGKIEQSLTLLGQATGTGINAHVAVQHMEQKRKLAHQIAAHDAKHHPRMLIVVDMNPLWTTGSGTFLDDLIQQAGGVNSAAALHDYATYSKEKVLANPPQIVLTSPRTFLQFKTDPVFSHLTAVSSGHAFAFPDENVFTRPGPRLADGLLYLAHLLHPQTP